MSIVQPMQFDKVRKFILNKLNKELPKYLTYHSVGHIKDVFQAAGNLAEMEKVEGEDLILLLTAVLFHDSGFLRSPQEHERHGCDIVKEYLPAYDYTPPQIARICGMIMATKIPQTPHNKLEEIICDADLDYLGREDFPVIGNKLYDELCMYGIINTQQDWFKLQVRFLSSHHYFTRSAIKLRKAKKGEHLKHIKSIIKNKTSNWDTQMAP
jgi:uncharacterized protein